MDVPITSLTNHALDSSGTDTNDTASAVTTDSVQLFQVQESYEKAVHVIFIQMSVLDNT